MYSSVYMNSCLQSLISLLRNNYPPSIVYMSERASFRYLGFAIVEIFHLGSGLDWDGMDLDMSIAWDGYTKVGLMTSEICGDYTEKMKTDCSEYDVLDP
jgi:hypothetical protein